MSLKELVAKYLSLSGGFTRPAALADFGLTPEELERTLDVLDDDYHISRYFHFMVGRGVIYNVNGFEQTHVTIDPEISEIL